MLTLRLTTLNKEGQFKLYKDIKALTPISEKDFLALIGKMSLKKTRQVIIGDIKILKDL